ncbi:MAG: type II 3-dehydroquinate dehydratase [Hyphomicrobiales bacterium]
MMKLIIINGPNLNLIGKRETEIYGSDCFEEYLKKLKAKYPDIRIDYYQSNLEGELVDIIQKSRVIYDGIILNAGAFTHTSIAIADAIRAISIPVIEVHISNIFSRESYRHKSMIATAVNGNISGFGLKSYQLAIESFI